MLCFQFDWNRPVHPCPWGSLEIWVVEIAVVRGPCVHVIGVVCLALQWAVTPRNFRPRVVRLNCKHQDRIPILHLKYPSSRALTRKHWKGGREGGRVRKREIERERERERKQPMAPVHSGCTDCLTDWTNWMKERSKECIECMSLCVCVDRLGNHRLYNETDKG